MKQTAEQHKATGVILANMAQELDALTPEMRKAAAYVLENPNDVSVSSIREISSVAEVKPNTFVRLARTLGFGGYEEFRSPFRDEIRNGPVSFPDRARWLQSLGKQGVLGDSYRDMVSSAIRNIEETFASIDASELQRAASVIWNSRQTFTLGVGVNSSNAQNFTYLASTGMVQFHAIPKPGSVPADDLAFADKDDVLIAITCKPYRNEVVEAVEIAREQGVTVMGISDSAASPIIAGSDFGFVVSVDTPQFFPSSVSTIALLETLLSFVIASASSTVVERVDEFHQRRHAIGIYHE